jgi:hypothetical protein
LFLFLSRFASTRPGVFLSSSPASAFSRTPTLVLFGSVHQWILHSSDRTRLLSYDAKALIDVCDVCDIYQYYRKTCCRAKCLSIIPFIANFDR